MNLYQLAADDPNFTGRSVQTEKIEAILKSDRPTALISAVSGMGGVGKSVLARHVGNRLKKTFPDGQLYVDLLGQSESPRDPEQVLRDFLVTGFGLAAETLAAESLAQLQQRFYDKLEGKRILVVLDNAKDAAQVKPLLAKKVGCGTIVTSREKLADLPEVGTESLVRLDVMTEPEAFDLLDRLCGEKTRDRDLTQKLAQLCGYLPLALTIVGKLLVQTESLTLGEVVPALEQERLAVLKYRGSNDVVEAELDVEASFNLSYQRLLVEQQQVFGAVAVLRGDDFGVDLAAVLGGVAAAVVRRRLDQLVALGLVEGTTGAARYRLHDLVREFGRGKLADEQRQALAVQALGWYDDNANTFDSCLNPKYRRPIAEDLVSEWEQPLETIEETLDRMGVDWFEIEKSNLIDAVTWAGDVGEHQTAVRLTFNLVMFFQRRSLWRDWVTTHKVSLASATAIGDQQGIAQTMNNLGLVYKAQGKWDDAINCYNADLETFREIGDQHGIAQTMNNLGVVYQAQGKWDDAIDCYQGILETFREIGDQHGIAQTMNNLGVVYQAQGKWDDAIDCYNASLETKRAIRDQHGIATTMNNLGLVYQDQGKWDDAIDCYNASLETMRAIGDQQGIAQTMGNLGLFYQAQGKWDDAINCYLGILQTFRAIGDQQGIATTMNNLGNVYQAQGKWDDAIDCYNADLEISRAIGDQHGIAQTMNNLGGVYQAQGKWDNAINCYNASLETMRAIGDQHGVSQSIMGLGNVYQAQGKWDDAINCYNASIQGAHQLGDPQTEANGWFNLGLAQAQRSNLDARTSYQNAKALFQQLKLTSNVEDCDNAIAQLDKPQKKRSFPLWPTIVVLLLGYGLITTLNQPSPPAPPNPQTQPK